MTLAVVDATTTGVIAQAVFPATIDGYNSFYDSMERVLATIAG